MPTTLSSVAADLDAELDRGHGLHFSGDGTGDAQISQTAANESTSEGDVLWCVLQELAGVGDACQEAESIVLQDVHALMVCAEVVDFFAVDQRPEISADEFHSVQLVFEARPVPSEALDYPVAGGVANVLQIGQVILL